MTRVAMCPRCRDEVLVFTFHWAYHEFYCLACRGKFTFFGPRAAEETPELVERVATAKAEFKRLIAAGEL